MSFVPPAAINDAFSLLAALADPEKTKATLDEMKLHAESAQTAFSAAQAAQKSADEARKALAAERAAHEAAVAAHEADKTQHLRDMTAARQEVDERNAAALRRAAVVNDREKQCAMRELAADESHTALSTTAVNLYARQVELEEREARVASVLADLGPLAEKLAKRG